MPGYPPHTVVAVRPFTATPDGDEVIIGSPDEDVYLCVPSDGLEILEQLAAGHTAGQTVAEYERRHGQTPDIDDFIRSMVDAGLVHVPDPDGPPAPPPVRGRQKVRWRLSLNWISPTVARHLTGVPAIAVAVLVVAVGVALAVDDPGLLPSPQTLLFHDGHFALLTLSTFTLAIGAVLLHEMAHAAVARSVGARASLGIGNLMYVLVAQTDISGVWNAPRPRRYLAFVAGTIVDLVAASLLVYVLWAERRGIISLHETLVVPLLSAFLFTYFARIAFQFNFFLRTDVYYVIATTMRCRNLMADTEDLIRNGFSRLFRRPDRVVDQSGIPRWERRRIRLYAGFYTLGRVFWLAVLITFFLPILWGYAEQFVLLFTGQPYRFETIDFITIAVLVYLVDGGGLTLWIRSLIRDNRERRAARRAAAQREAARTADASDEAADSTKVPA